MERKPDPQQVEVVTVQPEAAGPGTQRQRLWLLLFFMSLWPWFWVSFGLFMVKDFRVTIVLYELFCCALPMWLFRREEPVLWPIKMSKRWLAGLIVAANLLILGGFKATHGMMLDWSVFGPHVRGIGMAADAQFWGYGVYLVVFNPLFEESFWRGTVYREWRRVLSPWRANLLSSVFFGAWHWIILQAFCPTLWAVAATLTVMVGGIIFAYTYEKTGALGTGIWMHGLGADLPLLIIVHTALIVSSGL